jgi:multiple sugar transport system ATP-binding protein
MDEPLSNLDAKLRVQMRTEVSRLQDRLGTTTVYVTHDQTEAMTLGDRVAVMRAGLLQQVGSPQELYNNPRNLFVAGFIGSPPMNFFPAEIEGNKLKLPMVEAELAEEASATCAKASGGLIAGIRPEHLQDAALAGDRRDRGVTFRAKVDVVESMGAELYVYIPVDVGKVQTAELKEIAEDAGAGDLPGVAEASQIVARLDPASRAKAGEEIELWLDVEKIQFFESDGGRCLSGADLEVKA